MQTLVIFIAIGVVALYIGGHILTAIFEILVALIKGTNEVVASTPNQVLRMVGRRSSGAKVQIDDLLIASADKTLRKKEIDALNAYKPAVGYVQNTVSDVRYESSINKIGKREFQNSQNKNVSDIDLILVPNKSSAKQKLESLLGKKPFPFPQPKLIQQVHAPSAIQPYAKINLSEPTIELPLWTGYLSKLNGYVYKEYERELNLVANAKVELQKLKELEQIQDLEIKKAYDGAVGRYEKAIAAEKHSYQSAEAQWRAAKEQWDKDGEEEQYALQNILYSFSGGDIEQQTHLILDSIDLPKWMPCNYEVKYDKETKILIVEHEFVDIGSINWVKTVMLKSGATYKPLNQKELKHATDLLYPSITLRLACELATQLSGDVEAIAINGWADYTVKATGNIKRAYCSSLLATIDDLKELSLTTLEPLTAFASLKGNVARALELTPIAPKIKINTNDSRFVDEKEVLGNLSNEQNLASMNWEDFEHLCRQLFEKVFAVTGATVKVTQASRDLGVDAVIFDPDPIRGGKIVVQAKRYVNTVDVSAVRDLWGTVMNEGAMKGILVTTSQYGPEAYSFTQNKPLQLINGNELLSLLEQHGYKFRINLEEARKFLKESNAFPFNKQS